jgi:adenylate cyclase
MDGLLFIDDEEGIRRSVARALKRDPYTVYLAKTGKEGVRLLKENRHQIATVISDYKMPGLSGMETLSAIGKLNPEVTRIILTGYATMDVAIQATNQGIDGFLTKPFDNKQLRKNIHAISLRKRLKQFVPESIYERLQSAPNALHPSYHEVTVLFSDIRGFTRMSQGVPPEDIATFLNRHFFSPMGEIAWQFNGTVDKHIGDSMMIVFGSPVSRKDDSLRAVQAAVAMQQKAKKINRILQQKNGFRLHLGIGIATGNVFSGVLGSFRKKEFTSIGMAVNIAARLQKTAKEGEILLCNSTARKLNLKDPFLEDVSISAPSPIYLKGIETPVASHRIVVQEPALSEDL